MSSSAGKNRKSNDAEWPPLAGITELPGIGPGRQKILESLGIRSITDLLLYVPRRYIDRKATVSVSDLTHGEIQTVAGEIASIEVKRTGRKTLTLARLRDRSGTVTCIWFNQPFLKKSLKRGLTYMMSGQVRRDRFGMALVHPEYEIAGETQLHTGRMVPVYRLVRGFGQRQMRRLADAALREFADGVADPAPLDLKRRLRLAPLGEALWGLHYPDDLEHAERARRRMAFDEMLLFQTLFARARAKVDRAARRSTCARPTCKASESARKVRRRAIGLDDLLSSLPFDLTSSQRAVLREVLADLESPRPMRRLIQGDVGCGKTVIASLGAVWVCGAGGQVALMCPTELLAEQHYETMNNFLGKLGHSVALLVGGLPASRQEKVLADLALGRVDVVVGTHSLFSERVDFRALRLVIIDEEQRFGVLQRARLLAKAPEADFLALSATPIPRTLALTAYGDLDISVVDELPPGRGNHTTKLVPENESGQALREVGRRMLEGEQAFYICPALEESSPGLADVETARREIERMLGDGGRHGTDPGRGRRGGRWQDGQRRVGVLTGRTKREDRRATIRAFEAGELACIVATSVLEVGIDVPRATLLVVEQADRFGLSQLHQMRGRVQRSSRDSRSYLIVPESVSPRALERLKALENNYDGFDIAEQDLMLRGPGEVFGRRQHGVPDLRFTSLPEDLDLLHAAREEAFRMVGGGGDAAYEAWLEAISRAAGGDRAIIQ